MHILNCVNLENLLQIFALKKWSKFLPDLGTLYIPQKTDGSKCFAFCKQLRIIGRQICAFCIDESISRWYRLDGHWTDEGFYLNVHLESKPVTGCELKLEC